MRDFRLAVLALSSSEDVEDRVWGVGFFQLEDVNLADYEPRSKSLQSLLEIEATS